MTRTARRRNTKKPTRDGDHNPVCINEDCGECWIMSRFTDVRRPHDVMPTLWGFVYLTIVIGSLVGKSLSTIILS